MVRSAQRFCSSRSWRSTAKARCRLVLLSTLHSTCPTYTLSTELCCSRHRAITGMALITCHLGRASSATARAVVLSGWCISTHPRTPQRPRHNMDGHSVDFFFLVGLATARQPPLLHRLPTCSLQSFGNVEQHSIGARRLHRRQRSQAGEMLCPPRST